MADGDAAAFKHRRPTEIEPDRAVRCPHQPTPARVQGAGARARVRALGHDGHPPHVLPGRADGLGRRQGQGKYRSFQGSCRKAVQDLASKDFHWYTRRGTCRQAWQKVTQLAPQCAVCAQSAGNALGDGPVCVVLRPKDYMVPGRAYRA